MIGPLADSTAPTVPSVRFLLATLGLSLSPQAFVKQHHVTGDGSAALPSSAN
jgi:hypothetical protein